MKNENNSKEKENSRSCFIITPIDGDADSVTFRKDKDVIESVFKPTLIGLFLMIWLLPIVR